MPLMFAMTYKILLLISLTFLVFSFKHIFFTCSQMATGHSSDPLLYSERSKSSVNIDRHADSHLEETSRIFFLFVTK
jgi:hypothetical protein